MDKEYNISDAPEFYISNEYGQSSEMYLSAEPEKSYEEQVKANEENSTQWQYAPSHKTEKGAVRNFFAKGGAVMQVGAVLLSVIVIKDACGIDLLKHDIFNFSDSGYYEEEWHHHHEEEEWGIPTYAMCYYAATGETFQTLLTGKDAESYFKSLIEKRGGNPDSLRYVDVYSHFEGSENESMSFYEYYECDETFYVLSGAFPELDNLEPNGDGLYPHGNEEYVMLEGSDGRQKYLELGTERRGSMTEDEYQAGISELKSQGAWYDAGSNTLYLNNFSTDDLLDVNWMGNGFKINVTGDCTLGGIRVWGWYYGGSVLITGTGTLTLNPDSSNAFGIVLEAEESNSCLMLDANVTVIINGKQAAIQAHATLADTPFYAKSVPNVSVRTYIDKSTDKHDAYLTKSGEDEPIKHIEFTPRSY